MYVIEHSSPQHHQILGKLRLTDQRLRVRPIIYELLEEQLTGRGQTHQRLPTPHSEYHRIAQQTAQQPAQANKTLLQHANQTEISRKASVECPVSWKVATSSMVHKNDTLASTNGNSRKFFWTDERVSCPCCKT